MAKTQEKKTDKPVTEKKSAEKKTESKAPTIEAKKQVKKKFIQYVEKKKPAKSKEAIAIRDEIAKERKWHPVFRGRFGKKWARRKSIAKWDKWRKPHGIDLDKGLNHGYRPKIGYGSSVELKGVHPSGYKEIMIHNVNDLAKINPKVEAGRIGATVGKRKRNMIVEEANKKGIWIFN